MRRTLAKDDEAALGSLRFSPERVRRPNSLRSDMGAFSPFTAAMLSELYGAESKALEPEQKSGNSVSAESGKAEANK